MTTRHIASIPAGGRRVARAFPWLRLANAPANATAAAAAVAMAIAISACGSGGGDALTEPSGNDAGTGGFAPSTPGGSGGSSITTAGTGTGGRAGGGTGGGTGGSTGPAGRAGVVVVDNAAQTTTCVPICVTTTTPTSATAPDWSYENGGSCVLAGTVTGHNQSCTTGQPIPAPESRAGVVVVDGTAHTTTCVPLCVASTAATSPSAPDWAYENNSSCVLPNSITGKNQTCMTGQPILPPASRPGVVVLDTTTGTAACVPLCVASTVPNTPTAPDWSYENNSSCVLPNSPTGKNQTCATLQAVPALAPRPGILLVLSGADSSCVALCAVSKTPTDPTMPDWSYENNAACVLPTSTLAAGRRSCTALGPPPNFVPPALTGTKVHSGFFVSNGRLLDAYGHDFVIRGISNPHLWFDTGASYLAWSALDNLASYGTNTIRVVWDTTTLAGTPAVAVPAPASLLAEDLFRIVQLKMIPMVEIHGTSGLTDPAALMAAAAYYVRPEVKKVLLDFQDYLLINIANEWNGTTTYVSAYTSAINLLRSNGINHTLVIDANSWGQIVQGTTTRAADEATWFANAAALLAADPLHNVVFSVHMYELYATLSNVTDVLGHAGVGTTLPLVVGEFGFTHGGMPVDWQDIIAQCVSRGIGSIAWSWYGNTGDILQLNMAQGWEGPLTAWGSDAISGTNGIQATSRRASIFP